METSVVWGRPWLEAPNSAQFIPLIQVYKAQRALRGESFVEFAAFAVPPDLSLFRMQATPILLPADDD